MTRFNFRSERYIKNMIQKKIFLLSLTLLISFTLFTQCAPSNKISVIAENQDMAAGMMADPNEKWGLKPVSIRITAAGHFIDFRYKVTEPEKAASLMDGKLKSYLIHQKSGKVLPVPNTKLGPLRSKAVKPKKDKLYSILFNNNPMVAHKGDKVTVAIGEYRSEDLVVE